MPAKITKKKNTNKQSLVSKLRLNTFKGRMIATVLSFALVGGGVMVYKSFAATAIWHYGPNAHPYLSYTELNPGCSVTTGADTVNGKANTTVIAMNCPISNPNPARRAVIEGQRIDVTGMYADINGPGEYRGCVTIKGKVAGGELSLKNRSGVGTSLAVNDNLSSYTTKCTYGYRFSSSRIYLKFKVTNGSYATVTNMAFERLL